jgi:hypothetical protein
MRIARSNRIVSITMEVSPDAAVMYAEQANTI